MARKMVSGMVHLVEVEEVVVVVVVEVVKDGEEETHQGNHL